MKPVMFLKDDPQILDEAVERTKDILVGEIMSTDKKCKKKHVRLSFKEVEKISRATSRGSLNTERQETFGEFLMKRASLPRSSALSTTSRQSSKSFERRFSSVRTE